MLGGFLPMRSVAIGGYGNFGASICRALADNPDVQLIAAGRSPGSATRNDIVNLAQPQGSWEGQAGLREIIVAQSRPAEDAVSR
jgi:predicted dinucleotide-binding enzyme